MPTSTKYRIVISRALRAVATGQAMTNSSKERQLHGNGPSKRPVALGNTRMFHPSIRMHELTMPRRISAGDPELYWSVGDDENGTPVGFSNEGMSAWSLSARYRSNFLPEAQILIINGRSSALAVWKIAFKIFEAIVVLRGSKRLRISRLSPLPNSSLLFKAAASQPSPGSLTTQTPLFSPWRAPA